MRALFSIFCLFSNLSGGALQKIWGRPSKKERSSTMPFSLRLQPIRPFQ
jgi:hypothetical protein